MWAGDGTVEGLDAATDLNDSPSYYDGGVKCASDTSVTSFLGSSYIAPWLAHDSPPARVFRFDRVHHDGLEALSSVGGLLSISYNDVLCQAEVDALVDAMEARGWSGSSSLVGNSDC
jgi:hypothetical protein